ncbi:MAG: hypothetical protein M3Y54_18965 [Bacteroidota bacterium]|nr:hypothetical protein [Bacteroidota bacterium]
MSRTCTSIGPAGAAGAHPHRGRVGHTQQLRLFGHRVQGVGEEVEQHPAHFLRHSHAAQGEGGVEAAGHVEIGVLVREAVVGQVQVALGQGIQGHVLQLLTAAPVSVEVCDLLGRRVATALAAESQPVGAHRVALAGVVLAPGLYGAPARRPAAVANEVG